MVILVTWKLSLESQYTNLYSNITVCKMQLQISPRKAEQYLMHFYARDYEVGYAAERQS